MVKRRQNRRARLPSRIQCGTNWPRFFAANIAVFLARACSFHPNVVVVEMLTICEATDL